MNIQMIVLPNYMRDLQQMKNTNLIEQIMNTDKFSINSEFILNLIPCSLADSFCSWYGSYSKKITPIAAMPKANRLSTMSIVMKGLMFPYPTQLLSIVQWWSNSLTQLTDLHPHIIVEEWGNYLKHFIEKIDRLTYILRADLDHCISMLYHSFAFENKFEQYIQVLCC